MTARHRRTMALLSLALAATATTGCGQTPNASRSNPAAASAQASPQPHQYTGDVRACLGTQAVLGHVAASTARWSPARQPFAKPMAVRIRQSSDQLASQGPQAKSPRVRAAVSGIARSFRALSVAMDSRNRRDVNVAMRQTRVSYRVLKATCSLD
jgi:hypothetical protein